MIPILRPAALALFLTASPALAEDYAGATFPGYARDCGYPILVERTPYLSQARIGAGGAPEIVIDPQLLQARQGFHRTFLIAHECAHHRMEHATRAGLARRNTLRNGIRDQELSADCWASEALTRAGMLPSLLTIADQFFRRGFVSPGGGYPSGIQRSNVIRHCGRIAVEKMKAAARLWHPAER